ncbi:MAG: hypothetical protein ACI9XO_002740 [Paraglaciecola sp.]|jgi:hypothetical protein
MSVNQTSKWLTVCLYYNEPWEEFLLQGVKPYVDVVMQAGIADYYYYQRCWERGPHIRLWFKGNAEVLSNILRPNLEEHFRQYFESRPSLRQEPSYPDKFPVNAKWYPNDSIQYVENMFRDYDFGGSVVYFIAQKQFNASSNIVLESLKNKGKRWTYDDAVSTAMKLHLSFAFAIGMDLEEMQFFFERMWQSWEPDSAINALQFNQKTASKDKLLHSFQQAYRLQERDLTAFANALWEALENDRNLGQEAYEDWIHRNINVNIEMGLVQEAGRIGEKNGGFQLKIKNLATEKAPLWKLYAEFIHQSNNRVGIRGKDEGYLFYVLKNSLKAVLENEKTMQYRQKVKNNF